MEEYGPDERSMKGSRAAHRYTARLVQRPGLRLWNNHAVSDDALWIPYGFPMASL